MCEVRRRRAAAGKDAAMSKAAPEKRDSAISLPKRKQPIAMPVKNQSRTVHYAVDACKNAFTASQYKCEFPTLARKPTLMAMPAIVTAIADDQSSCIVKKTSISLDLPIVAKTSMPLDLPIVAKTSMPLDLPIVAKTSIPLDLTIVKKTSIPLELPIDDGKLPAKIAKSKSKIIHERLGRQGYKIMEFYKYVKVPLDFPQCPQLTGLSDQIQKQVLSQHDAYSKYYHENAGFQTVVKTYVAYN